MIESNMGTVKIEGNAAVIAAELKCAIATVISGMMNAGLKREDAEELVDEIVEGAKKNASHLEEDSTKGLLELMKILKDILEE